MCYPFPFGFEGGIGDLIVLLPDHCLSVYLKPPRLIYVYAAVGDDTNKGNVIQMFQFLLVASKTKNIWPDQYQIYVFIAKN